MDWMGEVLSGEQRLGLAVQNMLLDRSNPTVAVIGCGYWGKNLVRNFYKLNALALVCDSTLAGRLTASELAPDIAVVGSIQQVLDTDVSGVVIATPAETHYTLARLALEAGKHTFVEKPLAL